MKKTSDISQKQGQELSKKLYRTISEQAKRLDDARSCARNVEDLFTPNLQVQRRKFCEFCERLIFSDPVAFGRKGEELLWRKGFYDVVSMSKKLKKNEYSAEEISHIQTHIQAGIGFYHHFMSKLQNEYHINLKNVIDYALIFDENLDNSENNSNEVLEWAKQAIHQCLIYLGDLSRYKLEIYPNWEPTLAIRYYLQAISFKPDYGMPHNQMGTLAMAMNQNNFLEAVYHYFRCLACKFSFEGTTNNLCSIFEKNSKFIEQLPQDTTENDDCIVEPSRGDIIKQFLARFLLLIDIWYFNKKVPKVYSLCHQTYKNLEECLAFIKPTSSESGETPTDLDSVETDSTPNYLTSDALFKIVVICLLCISKLKSTNSAQLSTVVAFTLGIYSQIIQSVTKHIQEAVRNYPLSEGKEQKGGNGGIFAELMADGKKKSKSKLRRKKILKVESDEDSDLSEQEDEGGCSSSDDDDDDSFIFDAEDILAESSDEESDNVIKISNESLTQNPPQTIIQNGSADPENSEPPQKETLYKKVQHMDPNDMLEIIAEENSLQSIKVLNDWLKLDQEVLKSCGTSTKSLVRQIVGLINLLNINLTKQKLIGISLKAKEVLKREKSIPLSEDIILKGVDLFRGNQGELDWGYMMKKGLTLKEEAVVRVIKLISFGKTLVGIEEMGVKYDEESNIFVCENVEDDDKEGRTATAIMEELEQQESERSAATPTGGQLGDGAKPRQPLSKMQHMGQLWLAAEVRALEAKESGGGAAAAALSPYLVLDADALARYSYMVKHLVHARKFVVVVPSAVVSALDDLKREKLEARDAIRWLESQFHRGNRFFRAQRAHERASIPFIKYPKKRDKEMLIYIQIIECCHFLAAQQKGASNVVTLLIGNQNVLSNGENKDFSYVGLAQSVGIAIEPIAGFYAKWKKSKGNR